MEKTLLQLKKFNFNSQVEIHFDRTLESRKHALFVEDGQDFAMIYLNNSGDNILAFPVRPDKVITNDAKGKMTNLSQMIQYTNGALGLNTKNMFLLQSGYNQNRLKYEYDRYSCINGYSDSLKDTCTEYSPFLSNQTAVFFMETFDAANELREAKMSAFMGYKRFLGASAENIFRQGTCGIQPTGSPNRRLQVDKDYHGGYHV